MKEIKLSFIKKELIDIGLAKGELKQENIYEWISPIAKSFNF